MSETYAERIARGAQSPAMQALIAAAPRPTREQLDVARAACASSTARFREREAIPVPAAIGRGCPCGCVDGQACIRQGPILTKEEWPDYRNQGHLHAGQCSQGICGRAA